MLKPRRNINVIKFCSLLYVLRIHASIQIYFILFLYNFIKIPTSTLPITTFAITTC